MTIYRKDDPQTLQHLFASIASSYDRANNVLSFGLHKFWNRKLVCLASPSSSCLLLDLCAGTGDIALQFLQRYSNSKAILLDFCPEMLQVAEMKGAFASSRFQTLVADAQEIPLEKESIDVVTLAYGIRNVLSPALCFEEVFRTLRRGGTFAILELTRPKNPLLYWGHRVYLATFLPLFGKWITSNGDAYQYLRRSILNFISESSLEEALKKAGFKNIKRIPLFGGIATIFISTK